MPTVLKGVEKSLFFDVHPCGFLRWRTNQCPVHPTTLWPTYHHDIRPLVEWSQKKCIKWTLLFTIWVEAFRNNRNSIHLGYPTR